MIRRSPCEAYLKYLIVHPDQYDDDAIRALVKMQQLDYLGKTYTGNLRTICVPPTPFFPEDRLHDRSQTFLRRERLEAIFHPNDAMLGANAILENIRAKELVETMLMGSSHPQWICTGLRRLGLDVIPEAIGKFKHYYFNVDLVDSSELKALMAVRLVSPDGGDVDELRLGTAHSAVIKSDARRNTAMSASPITTNIMNMLRMGLMPSTMDIARLADATRAAALGGGLDMAIRGLPAQGRDYALMAKMMTEILESVGDPSGDLQEGLARLAIETDDTEIPHINQLSDGSHTLDIQPINASEVKYE